jgi:hypothetical protein
LNKVDPNQDWESFERLRRANREHCAYMAFGRFMGNVAPSHQNFYKYEMIPGGFQFYYMRSDPVAGQQKVPVRQYWFTSEDADDCKYEKI